MARGPDSIEGLTAEFAKMPGIGVRTARRLAFYIQSVGEAEAGKLIEAIREVKERARRCSVCYNVAEQDPCPICSAGNRDRSTVCVVERVQDLAIIESSGSYRGLYHVLGGHIAPLDDVHPEDLSIDLLMRRVGEGGIDEVIIATNPDTEGDATANYLVERLQPLGVTLSMLARGVPAGGQIEYAARGTVAGAIAGRRPLPAKDT